MGQRSSNPKNAGVTLLLACVGGGVGWWAGKDFMSAAMGVIAGTVVGPTVGSLVVAAEPAEDRYQAPLYPPALYQPIFAPRVSSEPAREQAPAPRRRAWARRVPQKEAVGQKVEQVGRVSVEPEVVKPTSGKWALGQESFGIRVVLGRLEIYDVVAWMDYSPRMQRVALDLGARTAEDVLMAVMGTALPQYTWPPQEGSKLGEQWRSMVLVLADALQIPARADAVDERGRPRLKVVS